MVTSVGTLKYVHVYGYYREPNGTTPETGYVEFTPTHHLAHPETGLIRLDTIRVDLDANGRFDVDLLCTDISGMTPVGWKWFVDEKIKNGNAGYIELPQSVPDPMDFTTTVMLPVTEEMQYSVPTSVGIGPNMVTGETTTVPYGQPAALTIEMVGPNTFEVDAVIPEGVTGPPGSSALYVQPNAPTANDPFIKGVFWVDTDVAYLNVKDANGNWIPVVSGPQGPTALVVQPNQPAIYVQDLLWLDSDEVWTPPPDGGITDHGQLSGLSDPDHPISAVIGLQTALDGKTTAAQVNTMIASHGPQITVGVSAPLNPAPNDLWVNTT